MPIAIVVPVYNGAATLGACLDALRAAAPDSEIVVVDDGSTDDSVTTAAAGGARVVRLAGNGGAARARNAGARAVSADVLMFVDADVVVAAGVVSRVHGTLAARADVAAVFGSYDDRPRAPGLVSQWRNLLHHYVHQRGKADAFSFWAGCGAVRRAAFDAVGGFDERRFRHAIEDIELGYRLRAAGYRILLDRGMLVTHLKRWTLRSMLWTDLFGRALPWARLILERGTAPRDLNLALAQRWSVALVAVAALALAGAPWRPALLALAATAVIAVVLLNRDLYAFLGRTRGTAFALACVPLHLLYFVCSGVGFAYAWSERVLPRMRRSDA